MEFSPDDVPSPSQSLPIAMINMKYNEDFTGTNTAQDRVSVSYCVVIFIGVNHYFIPFLLANSILISIISPSVYFSTNLSNLKHCTTQNDITISNMIGLAYIVQTQKENISYFQRSSQDQSVSRQKISKTRRETPRLPQRDRWRS